MKTELTSLCVHTEYGTITGNMRKMLSDYVMTLDKKGDVEFLTPSIYADIFKD